jgi:DNA (cytosine-5)-methyltransferase 1
MQQNSNPIVIDLFAGAGGLSLGAARAGFKIVGAVEIDKHALNTHKNNFPQTIHLPLDISKLTGRKLLQSLNLHKNQLDGLIGGPPCQGFSTMGRMASDDSRSKLFGSFFRLVKEIHPRFFLAENVLGLLNQRFDHIREQAFDFVRNDYVLLPPLVVPAHEYGAPTSRTRVFFFGYDPKRYPSDIQLSDFQKQIIPDVERIRVKQALFGLSMDINTDRLDLNFHKMEYNIRINTKKGSFEDHISGMIPEGIGSQYAISKYLENQEVSGCIPTIHAPEIEIRYKNLSYGEQDPISRSIKLDPDGFCPTLRAGTGPERGSYQAVRPIHYIQPRVITPREAARLQGFPDWFIFDNTKWHSFRQIGNSVSPIVAEKLLQIIYQKMT